MYRSSFNDECNYFFCTYQRKEATSNNLKMPPLFGSSGLVSIKNASVSVARMRVSGLYLLNNNNLALTKEKRRLLESDDLKLPPLFEVPDWFRLKRPACPRPECAFQDCKLYG